ncbi:hypothetical protein D9C73_002465 [Collichthys lucidus]|uniref:Uncharacterized protein n=1 Tax=Collichthys lucidus TaxID=240159 RepID=A0A4U5U2S2_COLLU|nr:hypothetical protein D9C73_002465 [Collichthys lucidus]
MDLPFTGFELTFIIIAFVIFSLFGLASVCIQQEEERPAMRIFNLLYLLLLLVALVASVSSVRPGKQPATFGRTHLHPLAGRFSQPEEKISQTPLPTQTLPAPPLQSTLPLRLKHKNEEEKHEYDTVDGSQHRDVDVKWKTMGHREKDCCLPAALQITPGSQERPHGKGVVNAALPVELRTPEHKEITMGSKHQGLG